MKYYIGETVYTISIIDRIKTYTIIGKVHYKIFGFTYKTRYVCEPVETKGSLFKEDNRVISGRELHRIETK